MSRRWVQVALVSLLGLSLIANFFLVGVIARNIGDSPGVRFIVDRIVGAYPEEVRTEFRQVMRENRPRTFAALRDLRAAHEKVASTANASPYDAKAVEDAMRGVRDATTALQQLIQEYLLRALHNVKAGTAGQP